MKNKIELKLNVSTWNYGYVQGKNAKLENAIREIKGNGFGVELWRNWEPEPELFEQKNWPTLKNWLTGVKSLSLHSKCDPKDWDKIRQEIELASFLKADLLVVHVLNFFVFSGVIEAEKELEIDEDYFWEVLEFAEANNVVLTLENGLFSSLKRFCRLAGPERLKICLDVGHANVPLHSGLAANPIDTFIDEFKDRIIHLHFHDNHGEKDEHLVPGQGYINWQNLFGKLIASGIPLSGALELRGGVTDAAEAYLQTKGFFEASIMNSK